MELINEHLTRQSDLIPTKILSTPITIIGAGAIGGWTCLSLAKAGFQNIAVYDFDNVDIVNMNSQFFRFKDIGKPKVVALAHLVKEFTKVKIKAIPERYDGKSMFPGIVISAVDSMEARKTIWEAHRMRSIGTQIVIDPRMGAEEAMLFAFKPLSEADNQSYEACLYPDSQAAPERCTAKATIYTANMLSGLVVKTVKDVLTGGPYLRTAQWNIAQDDFIAFRAKPTA